MFNIKDAFISLENYNYVYIGREKELYFASSANENEKKQFICSYSKYLISKDLFSKNF
jgi:hypothetical protein